MPNKRLTRMVRVGAVALALIGLSASVAVASTTGPSDQQRLRLATDRFHSVAAAEKHGYAKFSDVNGISCIAEPGMGAMGIHYVDGALVGDPAEALRRPEAMVYAPGPDGKLRLAAVEYIVLKSDWDATHSMPPMLYGQMFMTTTAPNRYGLPDFYSLHVWAWKHNPAGMFAMWNPDVTCPAQA